MNTNIFQLVKILLKNIKRYNKFIKEDFFVFDRHEQTHILQKSINFSCLVFLKN
jgi:hypothetical protein